MRQTFLSIELIYFLLFVPFCTCENANLFGEIYKNITYGYQKQVFPFSESSTSLQLNFSTYLMSVYTLDETNEILTITVVVSMSWNDSRLKWNPTQYDNISYLIMGTEDIWLPYVYLINTADTLQPLGYHGQLYAHVTYSGTVYWNPGGVMRAKCKTDISTFPFDGQTCQFRFGIWGVSENDINSTIMSDKSDLTYFIPSSDWEVTSYTQSIEQVEDIRTFVLELSIKRQPLYNVVIIIFPTMLFSLMNPIVFILPVASGERVSLGMTILLSYAIFLTLVASSVPVSSNPICVLLVVMVSIMLLRGLIVICVIISVQVFYVDDMNDVSSFIRRLLIFFHKYSKLKRILKTSDVKVSGKAFSKLLDLIFFISSYCALIAIIVGFYIYVFVN